MSGPTGCRGAPRRRPRPSRRTRAAPGLRTMYGARTAGTSQTAYSRSLAGGANTNTASSPPQARPQTQNTTPNVTPMIAVTTMSRVRHAVEGGAAVPGLEIVVAIETLTSIKHERRPRCRGRRDALRACFLHRYEPDQVPRVCGLEPHSQRVARSPEAVFNCRRESTPRRRPATGEARRDALRLEPRRPPRPAPPRARLVVGLVAQALVDAPGHVALPVEHRRRRDRHDGSAEPWKT